MVALPKLAPSRMTVDEFLDWPGDGGAQKFELIAAEMIRRGADESWPSNPQPIEADATLFLESLDFSCRLAAIYENTHLARAGRES